MVKVAQHHKNASAFGAEGVLHGNLHIVECDKRSTGGGRLHIDQVVSSCCVRLKRRRKMKEEKNSAYIARLDGLGLNTFAPLHEDDSKATLCYISK
jgi:hypothetical protein